MLVCFVASKKIKNKNSFLVFVLVPSNSDDEIELKGLKKKSMFGFRELHFSKQIVMDQLFDFICHDNALK